MRDHHEFIDFTARRLNLDHSTVDQFATDFAREFGGDRFYVSKMGGRNQEIRNAYTGSNVAELARNYGLSERRVREIVSE